ncbi:superoxide dismutase family protein [Allobacillus sp. GCM10007491]|uniref:Superoxide dismutase [Cu-Zn] n=1 Tax=Allobacillus saliphilus TaxID=2912308 RepID=A0A941HSP0_9BACI|nr:superoxide dismutase family protein [Allobacillus saliphilus]MBR7553598.1 superoxide dismutase family protein [Allobacillus saliphilus]
MKRAILIISMTAFLIGCQSSQKTMVETDIYNADSDIIGKATISEEPEGVKVKVALEGLEPGFHGIHIHEFPKCEAPSFETAGNHWTIDDSKHGLMHPEGPHIGDMPNIEVGGDGTIADYEFVLPEATLKDGKGSIFSDEGKSLIIHSGQDDGVSQPAGNSGERVACAVIKKDSELQEGTNPGDQVEQKEEEES